MDNESRTTGWARAGIPLGAMVFIAALAVSAAVVSPLRPLHFFQSLIYLVVIVLARRGNAAGFGAGGTIAVAWNALNLFVTHLFFAGAAAFWAWLQTGQARRVDTMMVFVGSLAHWLLLVACVTATLQLGARPGKWRAFATGGVLVLAYMGLIIVTLAPR